jgi:chromosomal replication initiator protein
MPVDDSSTPALLWTAVADRIRNDLSPMVFGAWFSTTRALALEGDVLEVGVPNEFTRAWIEGHFAELVRRAATAADPGVSVRFLVADGEPVARMQLEERRERDTGKTRPKPGKRGRKTEPAEALRSKYTFGSFVIGSSNRFAHAAALAVAEAPGQAYNPLVIYGETGLGKTHLLQAIAHYVLMHAPGMRARYTTCEAFTNEFIAAIKGNRMDDFKRRYREEYDVLLIDDIHFLAGKDGIQEEFFHTFNTLHASGRQLVLTSDRAPREIPDLADRLRSRFEWGLLVDVQPPDIETRIAILHKRVAADRVRIDDPELLPAIARRVPTNIRELEGALTRVLAYASLTGRPASSVLVRETLRDLPDADTPVSVATIKQVVSEAFGIPLLELESAKRSQAVVAPRQLAMYLCRELTDATLPAIGREFGGRDHTTVLYAVQKISNRLHHDRREYDQVDDLIRRIKRHG